MTREYVRHRLVRGHHRAYPSPWPASSRGPWRPAPRGAYWMRRPSSSGPFGSHRRRGVEVRGCGCCLPIPLGLLTSAGIALELGRRTARSR